MCVYPLFLRTMSKAFIRFQKESMVGEKKMLKTLKALIKKEEKKKKKENFPKVRELVDGRAQFNPSPKFF